jgi:ferredoxin
MPKLTFKDERTVFVEAGTSILEAALSSGVQLYHTCGGNASCSTCRVRVLKGMEDLAPVGPAEAQILDSFDLEKPFRLGCQARLEKGEVEVEIPKWERAPRPNKTPEVPAP